MFRKETAEVWPTVLPIESVIGNVTPLHTGRGNDANLVGAALAPVPLDLRRPTTPKDSIVRPQLQ